MCVRREGSSINQIVFDFASHIERARTSHRYAEAFRLPNKLYVAGAKIRSSLGQHIAQIDKTAGLMHANTCPTIAEP